MTASSESVRARIRAVEGTGMRTFWEPEPTVWARTEGCHVWDAEGRPYLDLYAGFAVSNVGYCHPRVTEAIRTTNRSLDGPDAWTSRTCGPVGDTDVLTTANVRPASQRARLTS